jgi:hypothetical protein
MTKAKRTAVEQLDRLIDAYLRDLQEMPDDVVLDACGPEHSRMFRDIVKTAIEHAGKRRLMQARWALEKEAQLVKAPDAVDLAEARRYLSEAANDHRITLAARDLREIPDEEVRRLYLQLRRLEELARLAKKDGNE